MPAKSRQQYKFFKYLEENPKEREKHGLSEKSVKDFTGGMTKQKFAKLREKVKGK